MGTLATTTVLIVALVGGTTATLLDEVAAVVRVPGSAETHVITRSRVDQEGRIALLRAGATAAATLPLDPSAWKASLEWVVNQTLLYDEVLRLQLFETDQSDVIRELGALRQRVGGEAPWHDFLEAVGLLPDELEGVLRRILRVQKYLESRSQLAARVRGREVESYYQDHSAEFLGRPLEVVRNVIEARLTNERVQAEVKTFIADLRSRADIRYLTAP